MTSTSPVPTSTPTPASPPFSMQETFLLAQTEASELLLVRHGQQQRPASAAFTPAEWVDPPLSELGRRQGEAVGRALAQAPVQAVICSHLSRAHETARSIAVHHGLDPVVLPDLREVETYRDLKDGARPEDALSDAYWRGVQERFPTERRWDLVPFGESSAELRQRAVSTIEGLLAMYPAAHLVVVCHGGVINAYLAELLGITEDMFFLPAHGSITRVRRLEQRRVLHSLNDRDHLHSGGVDLLTY